MKRLLFFLLLLFFLTGNSKAAFKFADSPWVQYNGIIYKYDKLDHYVISSILYQSMCFGGLSYKKSAIYTISIGILWEVKDGTFPDSRYGMWGGDGFDYKDLIANITGITATYLLNRFIRNYW